MAHVDMRTEPVVLQSILHRRPLEFGESGFRDPSTRKGNRKSASSLPNHVFPDRLSCRDMETWRPRSRIGAFAGDPPFHPFASF